MLSVVGSGLSGEAYTIKTVQKYLKNSKVVERTEIKKEKQTDLESKIWD